MKNKSKFLLCNFNSLILYIYIVYRLIRYLVYLVCVKKKNNLVFGKLGI